VRSMRFIFKSYRLPVFSGYYLKNIIDKIRSGGELKNINVSLGKRGNIRIMHINNEIRFRLNNKVYCLNTDTISLTERDLKRVYILEGNLLKRASLSNLGNYYQLICTKALASPTIEINGIRMHRTKGILPWSDAKKKVETLRIRKGERVLDICTGLGYTAIIAFLKGGVVTSIEKDPNVLELAKYNPWSEELEFINILKGDAMEIIREIESESFDKVLNDPPRFSLSGELYSSEFFREIFRILKPGGRVFQYVGSPGEKYRGKKIFRGVLNRMKNVGFYTKKLRDVGGILGIKRSK